MGSSRNNRQAGAVDEYMLSLCRCLNLACLLGGAVAALAASSQPAGDIAVIAESGRALATVVVPRVASPQVTEAAQDLARYLGQISGACFPVVSEAEAPAGLRLDVGPTELAEKEIGPVSGAGEGIRILSHGRGVVIRGDGDLSTSFAVFRFLEKLGCRWLAPGEEHVPRRARLEVERVDVDSRPAYELRTFFAQGGAAASWARRVGMNGFFSPGSGPALAGGAAWPRGAQGFHGYHTFIAADTFAKHPEWHPLIGGRRVPTDEFLQLCLTAPGLADAFAAQVTHVLRDDPAARMVTLSPNDGLRWCTCAACRALDQRLSGGRTTDQGLDRTRPRFVGDRVFWFANEVATRVSRELPGKTFAVLAYVNYLEPPETVKLAPGVIPVLCHYAPADYSRPIGDASSEPNRKFERIVRRWLEVSPDLMVYMYVDKSMWWRLPRPVTRSFAADVRHLNELGVRRYFGQSDFEDWPWQGPLYYVVAKTLWDPAADPDRLAQEWCEGMFGPAARDMAEHYRAVEDAVRRTGRSYTDDPPTQAPGLYHPDSMRLAEEALARAEISAGREGVHARRVAAVAKVFRYGHHLARALDHAARWHAGGNLSDEAVALREGVAAREAGAAPAEATRFLAAWERYVELGVDASSMGGVITKGGRRCWNSDETPLGDGIGGWATFRIRYPGVGVGLRIEMDVWGESALDHLQVQVEPGKMSNLQPETPLSGKPQWETVSFVVPSERMDPGRPYQSFGLGGGDSQIWLARIRARETK